MLPRAASSFFQTIIPAHFNQPLLYRVIAKTDGKGADYSDGEENIIPVLSNRMLVTESLPINMNGKDQEHFVFEKLLQSNTGSTLQNQSLTVEYSYEPGLVCHTVTPIPDGISIRMCRTII